MRLGQIAKTCAKVACPSREGNAKNIAALCRFTFALVLASGLAARATDRDTIHRLVTDSVIHEVTPTGSMRPAIDETWWVLGQRAPFKEVRLDDVILWKRGDLLICHRVIMRRALSTGEVVLFTKGDSNALSDPEIIREPMYVETVVAVVKRLDMRRGSAIVKP